MQTRDSREIRKDAGNFRKCIPDIANDNAYVIGKGPKALEIFPIDNVLLLANDNINSNGNEDHR